MIDWASAETHLLLNPRLPPPERQRLESLFGAVPSLRGHVWLATSGTTGATRLVALSKEAILASAEGVNRHLQARPGETWCCVLPTFHVGGLGIYARAALTGSNVVALAWDPARFAAGGFALASLVPAQLRDLVGAGLRAPERLRAIVAGGGALGEELYGAARELGWPVLPSYGQTEAASQVATATGEGPALRILPHVEVRIEEGRIALKGASLLTGYAVHDEEGRAVFVDPKAGGWFLTDDRGEVAGEVLRVFGRIGEFVKIGGESVDLVRLDRILEGVRGEADAALVAVADERLGSVIHLVTTAEDAAAVVEAFNARVLPYERIRGVRRVGGIPRTELGKVRRGELGGGE